MWSKKRSGTTQQSTPWKREEKVPLFFSSLLKHTIRQWRVGPEERVNIDPFFYLSHPHGFFFTLAFFHPRMSVTIATVQQVPANTQHRYHVTFSFLLNFLQCQLHMPCGWGDGVGPPHNCTAKSCQTPLRCHISGDNGSVTFAPQLNCRVYFIRPTEYLIKWHRMKTIFWFRGGKKIKTRSVEL